MTVQLGVAVDTGQRAALPSVDLVGKECREALGAAAERDHVRRRPGGLGSDGDGCRAVGFRDVEAVASRCPADLPS